MSENPTHDHHFIPVFYLRNWVTAHQSRLVEYARRRNGPITARWTTPRGTGYQSYLYDATDGSASSLESSFMMPTDTKAAVSMRELLRPDRMPEWNRKLRSAWSRFIMSLLMRHPDDIAELARLVDDDWLNLTDEMRAAYSEAWQPGMPNTAEEYWDNNRGMRETARLTWLRGLIDNENVGRRINAMSWNVANLDGARFRLLTSDKPVCMSTTIDGTNAYIMLPITPTRLFIGVGSNQTLREIRRLTPNDLAAEVNREVVRNAGRFVFAADTSQTRFVENHFGRSSTPSWMARLAAKRAQDRLDKAA